MNKAEPFMGHIMAIANQQLIYAHLSIKLWYASVQHAATCHNLGPVASSSRKLLHGDTTPSEALTGRRSDIAMLSAAAFGTLVYFKVMDAREADPYGTKPSQFKPLSKPGILLGLADGTRFYIIRLASAPARLSPIGRCRGDYGTTGWVILSCLSPKSVTRRCARL